MKTTLCLELKFRGALNKDIGVIKKNPEKTYQCRVIIDGNYHSLCSSLTKPIVKWLIAIVKVKYALTSWLLEMMLSFWALTSPSRGHGLPFCVYLLGFCLFFCPPSANLHSKGSGGAATRRHQDISLKSSSKLAPASSSLPPAQLKSFKDRYLLVKMFYLF